jgi:hypothetical protein
MPCYLGYVKKKMIENTLLILYKLLYYCWICSVVNGGIVITIVTTVSWGGLV